MHLKMSVQSVFSLLFALVLLNSCSNNAQRTFYDKTLKTNKLTCLSFAKKDNSNLEKELEKLYKFDKNCPYTLQISYSSDIVCHSTYNVPQKVNSSFPSAFLTLEVRKGFNIEYSYYIDLTSNPTTSDLKDAFETLKSDILK